MDDENFMESFKAKDVFYYLDCHIKDLSKLNNSLDEETYVNLEKIWERYAYEHHLGRDEYLALRIAKVQVINAEKGLNNKFVKSTLTGGIGYDEPCPTRYPKLLSGLMMRMHEEFEYYFVHVNKYLFYDRVAQTSYQLEKKIKNLSKFEMCSKILTEQIKLLTVWKQDFANASHYERFDHIKTDGMVMYFAYGANCLQEKMLERCPNSRRVGEAVLYNHKFIIDDRGNSGGCASVKKEEGSEVRGIAWLVPENEIRYNLDKAEGVNMTPPAYKKQMMKIHILGTNNFNSEALVYISCRKEGFYARNNYIEKILDGLKENFVQEFDETSYRKHIKLS